MMEPGGLSPFLTGVLASVIAGAGATALGALPVFRLSHLDRRLNNAMLGFAAGVMLAATFFSLLVPALGMAAERMGSASLSGIGVLAMLCIGGATIGLLNRVLPHEHFIKGREPGASHARLSHIWLLVIAIAIHNVPEGLSVGVAGGSGDLGAGLAVMIGIGLQNLPEGLSVAVALRSQGYGRRYSFLVAAATGLLEPLGGVIGAGAVSLSHATLPWALAFSAGAMLYVISEEIIPETHREGMEGGATTALFGGFALMTYLDTVLAQ